MSECVQVCVCTLTSCVPCEFWGLPSDINVGRDLWYVALRRWLSGSRRFEGSEDDTFLPKVGNYLPSDGASQFGGP
jgi:hypothetical protein